MNEEGNEIRETGEEEANKEGSVGGVIYIGSGKKFQLHRCCGYKRSKRKINNKTGKQAVEDPSEIWVWKADAAQLLCKQ